jgi:hypothetical protein
MYSYPEWNECVWMMQEATEAHGGIFALCIAAAPRRLTSRFLNFLLSRVDCRRNRSQPFRLGISSTNPFPSTPRIPFSWHSLSPPSEPKHPLLDDRPERFFLNLPQGCLSAVTRSVSGPLWFSLLGQSSISDDAMSSFVCGSPQTAFTLYRGTGIARDGRQFISFLDDPIPPLNRRRPGLGAPLFLMALNPRASCATYGNRPPYTNLAPTSTNPELTSTPPLPTALLPPCSVLGLVPQAALHPTCVHSGAPAWALSLEGQRRPHQLPGLLPPPSAFHFPLTGPQACSLLGQLPLLAGQWKRTVAARKSARPPSSALSPPQCFAVQSRVLIGPWSHIPSVFLWPTSWSQSRSPFFLRMGLD